MKKFTDYLEEVRDWNKEEFKSPGSKSFWTKVNKSLSEDKSKENVEHIYPRIPGSDLSIAKFVALLFKHGMKSFKSKYGPLQINSIKTFIEKLKKDIKQDDLKKFEAFLKEYEIGL